MAGLVRDTTVGSTYRVQVRPDFGFAEVTGIVAYLSALGVTHLYSSPLLTARSGSSHGYDVTDPTTISRELGGEEGLARLVAALRDQAMGLVVDIVPNHVGVAVPHENPAWWSVLRDGPASPYARWFDIDWSSGPLIIPVLDGPDSLAGLTVVGDELRCGDHRFPIAGGTHGGNPWEIHERQHYRLVDWRHGDTEVNYRRFGTICDLAAVRVEDPTVFAATHAVTLRLAASGQLDGVRVDHIDGLLDPDDYLSRLRASLPDQWIVVEKILDVGESLPPWPVAGTTGYDALSEVCGVFIDDTAARELADQNGYRDVVRTAKREAGRDLLTAELNRLVEMARVELPVGAPGGDRFVRDALVEVAACLTGYRTYRSAGADRLADAVEQAGRRLAAPSAVARLGERLGDHTTELAQRFAQFTAAVAAKGVEDTAFYRWTRFVALNEVGAAPDHCGLSATDFHRIMDERASRRATSMTTLSTHDTKRSEDVRARLAVLSEIADRWDAEVAAWQAAGPPLDPSLSALLSQCAVGAWPIARDRLRAYAIKAAREAKVHTSWNAPNKTFEFDVLTFVDALYDDPVIAGPLATFAAAITPAGWTNSLGQKLVQLTMPGVPDTYQGSELWDYSLVDPDNRRPVDFATRVQLLATLDAGWLPGVDASGAAKLLVTSRALRSRRDRPDAFTGYQPLAVQGPAARHLLAFNRGAAIIVATRLPVGLARRGGFGHSDLLALPPGSWRDEFTANLHVGPTVPISDILSAYPVALLVRA